MVGVIVGRFQVPYLHPGHLHLIATALRENHKVMIILGHQGIKALLNENNPYSLIQREAMIKEIFPQVKIWSIRDMESDEEWSKVLDDLIKMEVEEYLPFSERYQDVTLYYSRDSFKEKYSGGYTLKEVPEIEGYSGTKLRNSKTQIRKP